MSQITKCAFQPFVGSPLREGNENCGRGLLLHCMNNPVALALLAALVGCYQRRFNFEWGTSVAFSLSPAPEYQSLKHSKCLQPCVLDPLLSLSRTEDEKRNKRVGALLSPLTELGGPVVFLHRWCCKDSRHSLNEVANKQSKRQPLIVLTASTNRFGNPLLHTKDAVSNDLGHRSSFSRLKQLSILYQYDIPHSM